ncbi:hypothetical protein SS50377_28237 [Spironucleus salmonicida]|uniref:Uncharacterized protein n=1 Tax=Spironucleus salmonicida TaxID=348837 RepID=V6M4Y4_9EUKA|nr:hypothetical protein SS50377_28237 [Spironucleus salmonicida]|eukprot:EST48419.1 Hypothetical protein SS50377_11367 [Spironucleus salmonicida]
MEDEMQNIVRANQFLYQEVNSLKQQLVQFKTDLLISEQRRINLGDKSINQTVSLSNVSTQCYLAVNEAYIQTIFLQQQTSQRVMPAIQQPYINKPAVNLINTQMFVQPVQKPTQQSQFQGVFDFQNQNQSPILAQREMQSQLQKTSAQIIDCQQNIQQIDNNCNQILFQKNQQLNHDKEVDRNKNDSNTPIPDEREQLYIDVILNQKEKISLITPEDELFDKIDEESLECKEELLENEEQYYQESQSTEVQEFYEASADGHQDQASLQYYDDGQQYYEDQQPYNEEENEYDEFNQQKTYGGDDGF